jgi:cell division protein FtsB
MQHKKKTPQTEMDRLASELAFTYDTLATISVHLESLQLAYTSCKADLKKNFCATRLGPKEKELLAAYDDLGLQVVHLERKIKKLETRLQEVRAQEATTTASSTVSSLPSSSPASSTCSFDVSPWTCNEPTFVMDDIVTPPYTTIDPTAMMDDCTSFINDSYYLYNTDSFDYLMIPSEPETYSLSHPDYYYPVLSVQ